jgi:predicted N-acyltransferase
VKGNSEGEFVFDWGWADAAHQMGLRYYPKVVVAVPFTPATGDRVLVAAGHDRAQVTRVVAAAARQWTQRVGASGVHVLFPREDEARAWESSGYLRRDGFQFHWHREGAATFDEYLARFTSKQRNQIKRELRVVRDQGIQVETLSGGEHTREIADAMHAFYASTIDKHGVWGRMYLNREFFHAIIERFRDRLAWVVARGPDGEPVGGAFNVAGKKRLYGRYWGASAEVPCLHFAVCYYEGIRFCIERGLDVFEPGAGGEHKRARGFVPTLTRSAHWLAEPRMRAVLAPWLERERAKVQRVTSSTHESDDDD